MAKVVNGLRKAIAHGCGVFQYVQNTAPVVLKETTTMSDA